MTNVQKMAYLLLGSVLLLNQYSPDKQETVSEPAGEKIETVQEGYVELQFGTPGIIRIQADTSYILETIETNSEGERVSGALTRTDSKTNESLTEIRSLMPIVSANEELVVTSDTLAAAEIELAAWSEDEAGSDQVQLDLLAT